MLGSESIFLRYRLFCRMTSLKRRLKNAEEHELARATIEGHTLARPHLDQLASAHGAGVGASAYASIRTWQRVVGRRIGTGTRRSAPAMS